MQITWTNCAEQMPPDLFDCIIHDLRDGQYIHGVPRCRLARVVVNTEPDRYKWTPYTPEKWKELNKCAD